LNKVLLILSFALLGAPLAMAQSVDARFSTEKSNYLVGEPLFVILTVSNKTGETIWLDIQPPDLAAFRCDTFAIEVPGASPAEDQWGCGVAGSCLRGLREVLPHKNIILRQLVNQQFRLQAGAYSIRAQTTIVVHNQDLLDSSKVEQVNAFDTLQVRVQRGSQNELEAAFGPIVTQLNDSDLMQRASAAAAITELAPPFLEDLLIALTNTEFSSSAVVALRKADTPKTRAALAHIATSSNDAMLRIAAIDNLGRSKDAAYLPLLFELMESGDKSIQNAAAPAAGTLGGSQAVFRLSAFVSSGDVEKRISGADGLGRTRARRAVPVLIQLLLDTDSDVRQEAVSNLWLMTHRAAFNGNQWADISTTESAAAVHQKWMKWWSSNGPSSEMHGLSDCSAPEPL
jgi:hypothetical protein